MMVRFNSPLLSLPTGVFGKAEVANSIDLGTL
jgi:hypothetical protein